jgi:hypothetical protein
MELETFDDEGQTNTDNKRQLQTNATRYIDLAYGDMKGICIHVLTTLSFLAFRIEQIIF